MGYLQRLYSRWYLPPTTDVDQKTGENLNPAQTKRLRTGGDMGTVGEIRNPDRPTLLSFVPEAPDLEHHIDKSRKRRANSQERWELQQLCAAGALDQSELPEFDEETDNVEREDSEDEDVEIEMVEEEPAFLKGYGRVGLDLSPVKIVKNPDGSLSQAAMMQSVLQKERRELKNAQRQSEAEESKSSGRGSFLNPVAERSAYI